MLEEPSSIQHQEQMVRCGVRYLRRDKSPANEGWRTGHDITCWMALPPLRELRSSVKLFPTAEPSAAPLLWPL